MDELTLGNAVRALQDELGESFKAGFEQGREMMAKALEKQLQLEREQAEGIIQDLIDARTIRFEGGTVNVPQEQTGVNPVGWGRAEAGIWYLTK
jgi:hypothetical protein